MKNIKILLSFLAFPLLLLLAGCIMPEAGDLIWYVATTGSDLNDCHTPERPCRRIGTAIERALPGDTIYLAEGTYRESNTHGDGGFVIDKSVVLVGNGTDVEAVHLESERDNGPVLVITGHHVHPTVDGVIIQNGQGIGTGDGVSVIGGGLTLRHSVVRNNAGTGIQFWTDDPLAILTLVDVEVTHNGDGGIMLGGLGSTEIDGAQISANTGSGGIGIGTISLGAGGALSIRRTTINGNRSETGMAGIWVGEGSTVQVMDSTISGHDTTAIVNDGELTLVNTTVSGNTVGIRNLRNLSLIHSTIAFNGRSLDDTDAMRLYIQNSIVLKEVVNDCSDNSRMESIFEGNNLACWPASDGALLLGPLNDNGGPTQTIALLPGSLAVDAASADIDAAGGDYHYVLLTDQRGETRPAGSGSDIGAYELQIVTIASTNVPTIQTVTPSDPTLTSAKPVSIPMFTFSQNAFGRQGPGVAYEALIVFLQGQIVQIDGRNLDEPRWWWVLIPGSSEHGWVSDSTGSASGPIEGVPVIIAPPLPTPSETLSPPFIPTPTATLKY